MRSKEEDLRLYFSRDRIAEYFGIELIEFGDGYSKVKMPVLEKHLNGFDVVHGAALFAMADFAFAVASNSHGTVALAINTDMSFVKAVEGGTLFAEATEMSLSPKLGTYNIMITDEKGDTIAIFHGMAYRKKDSIADHVRRVFPDLDS
jgi:acyl-CoA thioesterase